jgi:putative ABC transport system permease protein
MSRLEASFPDDNTGRGARISPLREELVADARTPLLTLLGAVAGVLLIACGNVANLLLARGTVREREIAMRAALGASRWRIVRALLIESAVLGAIGGAAGVVLAHWCLRALRALAPAGVPGAAVASLDGAVLLASALMALASVLVFGLLPSWRGSRVDSGLALAGGQRAGGGRGGERSRHLLVAAETAMSVVLVMAAALLARSFLELRRVDLGYDAEGLATLRIELPPATYPQPEGWPWLDWPRAGLFHESLLERVRALPGVRSAALALNGPTMAGWTTRVTIEGRPQPPTGEQDEAAYAPVSADYLPTLRVPLLRGRWLAPSDRAGAPLVVVVNQSFVHRHFGADDPIGQRLQFFGVTAEVVGVVDDMRGAGLLSEPRPTFYPALAQHPWGEFSLVARTSTDPALLAPALRAVVGDIDPEVAAFEVTTARELVAGSIASQRFMALLLGAFAGLALVLASVGVYGVVAFSLAQRTREIGLRIALGADRGQVLSAAMRRGLVASGAGIMVGLVASFAVGRLLRAQLHGIAAHDPTTYAMVVATLLAAALLAAWLPARRATRIEPSAALRQE